MFIETIKTPGIAHLSYVVGNAGEACVIDPQLDTDTYLKIANNKGCRISAVFETHRNEDFISGALTLSNRTKAAVYHGPNADEPIPYAETVNDGDLFQVGAWKLTILTTPGHTKDSICIAVTDTDSSDDVIGVFTGDTLFVSDVGRTDFYPEEKEYMASQLYHSLKKILGLGEHVIVYPAHGAGSVCGGGMADREFSTLGMECRSNPLLKLDTEQAFIDRKVNEHHYISPYFSEMEAANVKGVDAAMPAQLCSPLSASQRETWLAPDKRPGILVDLRDHAAFREHHVPASLNLPGGLLAPTAAGCWRMTRQSRSSPMMQRRLTKGRRSCGGWGSDSLKGI